MTVITNSAALSAIVKASQQMMHIDHNPLYNATAFVVVSAAAQQKAPGIEFANTGCIVENMLLAATALGIDSIYIWGVLAGTSSDRDLWTGMGVPESYRPVSAAAFGYSMENHAAEKELSISLSVNYV